MLAALVLLAPAPLRLELTLPKAVAPGETIEAKATVRNVSSRPVVLALAVPPNFELGMFVGRTLTGPRGGVEPDERGGVRGQWFVSPIVHELSFFTLAPGGVRELYAESFSKRFLGKPPSLISEVADAPCALLTPGTYRYRIVYRLQPKAPTRTHSFGPDLRGEMQVPRKFTPEAKRLFDALWRGEIAAEGTFSVAPRP